VKRYPELADGDVVRVGNLNVTALHTPGHSADHLSFWLDGDRVVFTGDLVLGRGSSMVTFPEGDVAAYLRSLERLESLQPRMLFPGHWDPVTDAMGKLEEYRTHRLAREAQVLAELKKHGRGTAPELTLRVYGTELGGELLRAAEMTLRAHLKKLIDDRKVKVRTAKGEEVYERSVS
jgi:hydroxyacylglutathione hydrolase